MEWGEKLEIMYICICIYRFIRETKVSVCV